MNVEEFRRQCPKLYQQVFAAGVNSERRKVLAADLIANSESQPPQINSPAMVVERLQESKKWNAQARLLRGEIGRQLAL